MQACAFLLEKSEGQLVEAARTEIWWLITERKVVTHGLLRANLRSGVPYFFFAAEKYRSPDCSLAIGEILELDRVMKGVKCPISVMDCV